MQAKWDNLDSLIADSAFKIELSSSYNEKLQERIHEAKVTASHTQRRIAAISLIAAGFLIMATCSTTIQYKLIEYKIRLKGQVAALQYQQSDKLDFIKILIGE